MTDPPASTAPLIVVGMNAEARIAAPLGQVAVGAAGMAAALRVMRPSVIISFGLCAGLDPALAVGDLLAGSAVVGASVSYPSDAEWTARFEEKTGAKRVLVAGAPGILASTAQKSALRANTDANAADMESLAVAEAAARVGLPFAVLRAVSDAASDTLPRSAVAGFRPDGEADIGAVLRALARRPMELRSLVRTGSNARTAMRSLARGAERLADC